MHAVPKPKKKKGVRGNPTYKGQKKKAWDMFSLFIRIRDCLLTTGTITNGKCITCEEMPERKGTIYAFQRLQAGHFIAGRGNAYLFDEKCVHAQCSICNFHDGEGAFYYTAMEKLYGKTVTEEIKLLRHQSHDFTIEELKEKELIYKEKYEKLFRAYVG